MLVDMQRMYVVVKYSDKNENGDCVGLDAAKTYPFDRFLYMYLRDVYSQCTTSPPKRCIVSIYVIPKVDCVVGEGKVERNRGRAYGEGANLI